MTDTSFLQEAVSWVPIHKARRWVTVSSWNL